MYVHEISCLNYPIPISISISIYNVLRSNLPLRPLTMGRKGNAKKIGKRERGINHVASSLRSIEAKRNVGMTPEA